MAWSVFSSESVSRSQLDGLMRQFGATPTVLPMGDHPEPGSWSVPITDGELVISEATADLRAMPPAMIESAARLLGTTPRYCLSIFAAVGGATGSISAEKDDSETAQLVQRIVNAFADRLCGSKSRPQACDLRRSAFHAAGMIPERDACQRTRSLNELVGAENCHASDLQILV